MNIHRMLIVLAACSASVPLLAQSQIGGGACSSASVSGAYSLTLTGRDVSSSVVFTKVSQGIGTATFDGLSKVTFSLTTNLNQTAGVSQTLSGTYSMQANCIGVLNITSGDTATYSLESYNQGKDFLITGQDATYSYAGSGVLLPTACSTSQLSGNYSFNGNGFSLASGVISGVNNISGTLQFDGISAVTGTWYIAAGTSNTTSTVTGQFAVTASCTGTGTVTDSRGNTYSLLFTVTATSGSSFLFGGAGPTLMFIGNGRTL
jgi:hypothetical protein